ncbi:MAG TPA: ABC transporter ATP-binding protein [Pelotomaculum sp.]|nr:ABC transporter ATP-binding protein [Pelotomaculum sp.]
MLEAVNISKIYGLETVFHEVSLSIQAGESLAITGLSGSGKSTLLSVLGLLLEPNQGKVFFQGQNVSDWHDNEKSRLRNNFFGFIFQYPQLIGSLSVLENILVPARLARRANCKKKAEEVLHDLGMQNRITHLPHQLSIGQKRRVAIARAVLLEPLVILADEPTNDLDPDLAARVGEFLFELPKKGNALILVTHDLSLAQKASKVVRLVNGKVGVSQ